MSKFNKDKLKTLHKIDLIFKAVYFRRKNNRLYPPIEKNGVKNIAIIGMMMIGDTIMCIPSLKTIRKNFRNAKVTMICSPAVKDVLISQNLVDNFIIVKSPWLHKDYSRSNIAKVLKSFKQINTTKFDLAIDFRGDWRNILFMNFIKAVRKVSFNYSGGEYMLTDSITPDASIDSFTEEWLYLLKQIGCDIDLKDTQSQLVLNVGDEKFKDVFKHENNITDQFIIGVHPGASQEVKRWNEKKFAELIIQVSKTVPNCLFIIFQGPGESSSVIEIENLIKDESVNCLVLSKGLHDYITIMSICNLVICNDSGAAHIADAFNIPGVVIFGNTDPKLIANKSNAKRIGISHALECKPCNQDICKFGTNLCIESVFTQEVYLAVMELIPLAKSIWPK